MTGNIHEHPLSVQAVTAVQGDMLTIRVSQTRPPGARVSFEIAGVTYHGKVVRQVRLSEDALDMHIRMNSLSRTDREKLLAAADQSS